MKENCTSEVIPLARNRQKISLNEDYWMNQ